MPEEMNREEMNPEPAEELNTPPPAKQIPGKGRLKSTRGQTDTRDPLKRKMAYIILFETIFIVILIAMQAYLVYKIHTSKTPKTPDISPKLQAQITELTTKLEETTRLKEASENEAESKKQEIVILKNDMEKASEEIKRLTEAQNPEKFTAEIEKKQEEINGLNDRLTKATRESEELSQKLAGLEEEYNKLKNELSAAEANKIAKQQELEKIYGEYEPKALKSLEELKSINSALENGIDVIKFAGELNRITPAIEELKKGAENYSKLASYHLIKAAFDSYKTSEEIWKRLSITYLPEEVFDLPKKELKLEAPIKEYRPWVDGMQINWLYARYYLSAAEALIKNKEDLQNTQCPACLDKLTIVCPKCGASGQCFICDGHGIDETKGDTACVLCEGSGNCSLCGGKKEITCPVWILTVRKQ